MKDKVVLVTGASSGIGSGIAARLRGDGHRVYGTSRAPEGAMPPGVEGMALDLTCEESIVACVDSLIDREGRIDVLVNNAGVDFTGAVEECALAEARAVFETNLFGMMRLSRATLPAMRARGTGQIVNLGSAAGLAAIPYQSLYSASKYAVEGFSEALMHEVEPFGISVFVVEPGFHRSELGRRMQVAGLSLDAYRHGRDQVSKSFRAAVASGPDPERVARRVSRIVSGRRSGFRHPIGLEARLCLLKPYLPDWVHRRVVRWLFGLEAHPVVAPVLSTFYRSIGRGSFLDRRLDAE